MKTVIGLYKNFSDARQVVTDLTDAGFDAGDISFVANDSEGTYAKELGSTATSTNVAEGAATGAVAGGVLGGLGGVLLGLGALAIPGIGPVIAAGPIAAGLTGAAVGATAGGLVGALAGWGVPEEEAGYYAEGVRRGNFLVAVRAQENRVDDVIRVMNRYNPLDIQRETERWRSEGWKGFDYTGRATDRSTTGRNRTVEDETAIPIVEEELRVGKREVERGGLRVHTWMEETPVQENVELREERARVERRPVDRPATADDLDAFQERTIEVREMGEEVVAEKRARVIEEVVIGKEVGTRTETVQDTVRRTQVDVDNFDDYNDRFQNDYNTNYTRSGYAYDQYRPAYQYGYTLARDDRYANRNWSDIEPDVRRVWEQRNPNTWEDFKDAIRRGWEEVKATVR